MQALVLWAAVVFAVGGLVLSVVLPIVDPDGSRKPLPLGGAGLVFRVVRLALITYACLYAVGVVG